MCGLLLCDIHESLCRGYHRTDFSNLVTATLLLRPTEIDIITRMTFPSNSPYLLAY